MCAEIIYYEVYNKNTGKIVLITKEMLEALKPKEDNYIVKEAQHKDYFRSMGVNYDTPTR